MDDELLLLVIDVQNDFCAGGALAVPNGEAVVPIINGIATSFAHVVLTQDWHPRGHSSFASSHLGRRPFETVRLGYGEQMLWPDHCVQGTGGAAFHPDLAVDRAELIIRKGYRAAIDSYSAFAENDHTTATGLAGYLRERGLTRLYLVGLATDYCVLYSALDAASAGFRPTIVTDACRAIDQGGSLAAAYRRLQQAGIPTLAWPEIVGTV